MPLFDKENNNPAVILKLDQPPCRNFLAPTGRTTALGSLSKVSLIHFAVGHGCLNRPGASVSVNDSQEDVRRPPEHQISSVFVIQPKPRQCKPSIHIIY